MSKKHIFLIEDDKQLSELICLFLKQKNFECTCFYDIKGVKSYSNKQPPDLILCDIMLPDGNGYELFSELKSRYLCPILFLTALDSSEAQIKGLELGAHDYLVKPIIPEVLHAKIINQLNFYQQTTQPARPTVTDFEINHELLMINYRGNSLGVNFDEFQILSILVNSDQAPVSREHMFSEVLKREYDGLDRAIDLKISRLRKKLQSQGVTQFDIKTIRGKGYALRMEK